MPTQPRFHVVFQGNGFTIEATWFDGRSEMLAGLFVSREAAQEWLDNGGAKRWAELYPNGTATKRATNNA